MKDVRYIICPICKHKVFIATQEFELKNAKFYHRECYEKRNLNKNLYER